ncbi:MAG: glycosyltransferase family 39 protein, partial [Caldilinea sp.]
MSSLSQRNSGQEFVNPPVRAYIAAYGLWFFTFLVGLLVAFAVRDLYQMAMVFTTWDRYAVHVFNQVGVVVLVVLLLILLVVTEAYYRNGVPRGKVFARFARVIGILALILAAAQILRLTLEGIAGSVNLISVLILAVVLLVYVWARTVVQRRAQPAAAVTDAPGQLLQARVIVVAALIAGAVLIVLPIKAPLNLYDEGLALVNGMRVLHGDIPFRDYWAIYPPGQSYVLAALFGVAGENIFVERIYDTTVRILLALVIYLIAVALLRSWRWAVAPYLAAAVLLAAATFYGYAVFPALLFGFAALLLSFRYLDTDRLRWLAGAGLLVGVTTFFRLDLGFYAAAAVGMLLILTWLLPLDGDAGWGARTRRLAIALFAAGGPAALLVLAFYGYLGSAAGLDVMVENLLVFPATTFRAVRQLPYPPLLPDWSIWSGGGSFDARLDRMLGDYLRFYMPLLVYGLSALLLVWSAVRALRGGRRFAHTDSMAASLVVMGTGLFVQALSRYDEIHVLPASLVVVILITWLVRQIPAERWDHPWVAAPVVVLLLVPVALYFVGPYVRLSEIVRNFPPQGCYSALPRAGCVPTLPGQEEIVQILDQQSPDHGPIFSGLLRHDNVFVNDVSVYFLAGRPISTRYHELHPGVTTTQPVQEEM